MEQSISDKIKNLDFIFKHSPTKIIANKKCPEITLAGISVGPLQEGNEYEIEFWIARKMEKSGLVRFRGEELLDTSKLHKIQWTELVQKAGKIAKLPENFYPKLRIYLQDKEEEIKKNPQNIREYEKIRQAVQDIINLRLKKIVTFASAPAQSDQILKNFTNEERFLYEKLHNHINEWSTKIME